MSALRWMLAAILALSLVPPAIAADQQEDTEPPPDEQKIEFRTGWQDSDTEGSLVRVAEYEVVGSNPVLGLYWATSPYERSRFDVKFDYINADQNKLLANWDMDRMVRLEASVDSLLHRLDHDTIDNLQAVSDIKVVRRTDNEPDAEYAIQVIASDASQNATRPEELTGRTASEPDMTAERWGSFGITALTLVMNEYHLLIFTVTGSYTMDAAP